MRIALAFIGPVLIAAYFIASIRRIVRVGEFRSDILDLIHAANLADMDYIQKRLTTEDLREFDVTRRFKMLEMVPFNEMCRFAFWTWRPLRSYWTEEQWAQMTTPTLFEKGYEA
jgi:hypothetical protein